MREYANQYLFTLSSRSSSEPPTNPRIVPLEHHLHGLEPLVLDRHPNVGRPSDQSEPDPVETLHQLEEDGLGGPLGEGDLLGDGEVLGVVDEEVELHADLVDVVEGARLYPVADGLDLAALDVDLERIDTG